MLIRCLACLCLLLPASLGWAAEGQPVPAMTPEAAATAENPPAPTGPTGLTDAQKLYEQVNALLIIRGLGITDEQLEQLLPILENLRDNRTYALQTTARAWQQDSENLQAAIEAAVTGRAAGEALAPAQKALADFQEAAGGLLQANQNGATQLAAVLSPAQESLYESLPQYLVRQQSEALLGGAPSVQDYFVSQIDLLRSLSLDEYRLVRYWEAERLASLLRPPDTPGFAYLQSRLLDAMDTMYLRSDGDYLYQRANLARQIAQYLGLQETVRSTYFRWSEIALLLTSDQTPQVIQQLLGQTPQPVPTVDPEVQRQAREMRDAAAQAQVLLLARSMALTAGQLAVMQPLVQQAATARGEPGKARATQIARRQAALHEMRDSLLAGPEAPPGLDEAWTDLQQAIQEERQIALGTATEKLVQTRDYLTADQVALLHWPLALAGGAGRQAQLEELRYIAVQMSIGYTLFDHRYAAAGRVARRMMRPARTLNVLNEYVPQDSPYRRAAEQYLLDMVRQARAVPAASWEATWPRLVTEMMVALGAVPGPGVVFSNAPPEAWDDYFTTLTDPVAPDLLERIAVARGG